MNEKAYKNIKNRLKINIKHIKSKALKSILKEFKN